ncbi:MAG: photosynthetic complex assembly protein PuhC [Pseudomonadota bacterium]
MTDEQSDSRRRDTAPPTPAATHNKPVLGAFAVAGLAVLATGTAVLTGTKATSLPVGEVVESRSLFFRDASNGRIAVYDGQTRRIIIRFEKGEGAFVRQSMRALNHTRRVSKKEMGNAFTLARTDKNIMLLSDPTTGERIKLNAFGSVALKSFTRFLPSAEAAQKAQTATRQKGA